MKNRKDRIKNDKLYFNMLSSIISMLICIICFIGSTSAWFTSMRTTTTQIITSANYSVEVKVANTDGNGDVSPDSKGVYELSIGSYTVTLTANGNASTGFCIITLESNDEDTKNYYTKKFPNKEDSTDREISFEIKINEESKMKVTPSWGKYDGDITFILVEGIEFPNISSSVSESEENTSESSDLPESSSEIEESVKESEVESSQEITTEEETTTQSTTESTTESSSTELNSQIYIIQLGDNLYKIAQIYGIDVNALIAYNQISDPEKLEVGQIIKIPPSDYKVPEITTTEEETTTMPMTESQPTSVQTQEASAESTTEEVTEESITEVSTTEEETEESTTEALTTEEETEESTTEALTTEEETEESITEVLTTEEETEESITEVLTTEEETKESMTETETSSMQEETKELSTESESSSIEE